MATVPAPAMQQLVDLAQAVQELAASAGLKTQELRVAQIQQGLMQSLAGQGPKFHPAPPAEPSDAASARRNVRVSVRELCSSNAGFNAELRDLRLGSFREAKRVGLPSLGQRAVAESQQRHTELSGQVSELQGGLESAAGRWALEAAEMRQTARTAQRENQKAVESLTQLAQEAKASLELHEARLARLAEDEDQTRELARGMASAAAEDALQRASDQCQQSVEQLRSQWQAELAQSCAQTAEMKEALGAELQEVKSSFAQVETEVLAACSSHRQALQGMLEEFAGLWRQCQKRSCDLHDQLKDFQQLVLGHQRQQQEAMDSDMQDFRVQLDKVIWQKSLGDWPRAEGAEVVSSMEDVQRHCRWLAEHARKDADVKLATVESKLQQESKELRAGLARLEQGLSGRKSDPEGARSQVLEQMQSSIQSLYGEVEVSATNTVRINKSLKHMEAVVKDMSVSVAQNSERIEQLRASANSGNSAADRKRVDALFRHVEGLKTDLAAMDRTERSKPGTLATIYEPRARIA
ncbi:unnamed protein product [Effrenium voratum]|nr:unnamed protein product [Effrenium voratum]